MCVVLMSPLTSYSSRSQWSHGHGKINRHHSLSFDSLATPTSSPSRNRSYSPHILISPLFHPQLVNGGQGGEHGLCAGSKEMHPADIFSIHVYVVTSSGGAVDALAAVTKEAVSASTAPPSICQSWVPHVMSV